MKSNDSKVFSSFKFELNIMFNSNVWAYGGNLHTVLLISLTKTSQSYIFQLACTLHSVVKWCCLGWPLMSDVTNQVIPICTATTQMFSLRHPHDKISGGVTWGEYKGPTLMTGPCIWKTVRQLTSLMQL
jgi:hypothetical protein